MDSVCLLSIAFTVLLSVPGTIQGSLPCTPDQPLCDCRNVTYFNTLTVTVTSCIYQDAEWGLRQQQTSNAPDDEVLDCSDPDLNPEFDQIDWEGSFQNISALRFVNCNLTQTNFSFLTRIPFLMAISLESCLLERFSDFPVLPTLLGVVVNDTQLQEWYPVEKTPLLQAVNLLGTSASNTRNLLNSLVSFPFLRQLGLFANGLDSIPPHITQFTALEALAIIGNPIHVLQKGSLNFTGNLPTLNLALNQISRIEEDAIAASSWGNFQLDLTSNNIKQLNESVFKPLLMKAQQQGGGMINILSNPLECGCDVRWLIVDNPDLLQYLPLTMCEKGSFLVMLRPQDFDHCDDTGSTSTTTTTGAITTTTKTSTSTPNPNTSGRPVVSQVLTYLTLLLLVSCLK